SRLPSFISRRLWYMTYTIPDATPRGPYRQFTDHDGNEWLVWQISEDAVDQIREAPSLGRAWLIFLGPAGETRRLAPVPTRWRALADDQLRGLALAAVPFVLRAPS
ncbi:MAG TPA: hypothetical protein VJN70_19745, partial [Gemmatimonadaceae bacterium]|nr:hypothetical protein [Gemmatimonadaceae bacterium]